MIYKVMALALGLYSIGFIVTAVGLGIGTVLGEFLATLIKSIFGLISATVTWIFIDRALEGEFTPDPVVDFFGKASSAVLGFASLIGVIFKGILGELKSKPLKTAAAFAVAIWAFILANYQLFVTDAKGLIVLEFDGAAAALAIVSGILLYWASKSPADNAVDKFAGFASVVANIVTILGIVGTFVTVSAHIGSGIYDE